MKRILILLLTLCAFVGYGQILQDPSTTPSTARTNEAIAGAYTASGTDTYTISPVGSFSYTYLTGKAVSVTFTNINTGASTLNFDGLGAKNIYKWSSGSLGAVAAGDLVGTVRLRYDGTQFVMEGGTGSGGSTPTLQSVLTSGSDVSSDFDVSPTDPILKFKLGNGANKFEEVDIRTRKLFYASSGGFGSQVATVSYDSSAYQAAVVNGSNASSFNLTPTSSNVTSSD